MKRAHPTDPSALPHSRTWSGVIRQLVGSKPGPPVNDPEHPSLCPAGSPPSRMFRLKAIWWPSRRARASPASRKARMSPLVFDHRYWLTMKSHTAYDFEGSKAFWSWVTPAGRVGNRFLTYPHIWSTRALVIV